MYVKKTIIAYLDGEYLTDVVEAALDNNIMVEEMKKRLIKENKGHTVTFQVEEA